VWTPLAGASGDAGGGTLIGVGAALGEAAVAAHEAAALGVLAARVLTPCRDPCCTSHLCAASVAELRRGAAAAPPALPPLPLLDAESAAALARQLDSVTSYCRLPPSVAVDTAQVVGFLLAALRGRVGTATTSTPPSSAVRSVAAPRAPPHALAPLVFAVADLVCQLTSATPPNTASWSGIAASRTEHMIRLRRWVLAYTPALRTLLGPQRVWRAVVDATPPGRAIDRVAIARDLMLRAYH